MQKSLPVADRPRRPEWVKGRAPSANPRYFQILGEICTRACRYCYVHSGKPDAPPDPLEPFRLAQAAAQMGLSHVVVTSVDRDDIPDRGAGHYAATIRALQRKLPGATVEILTPDFLGVEEEALATVLDARPAVFGHNIETVRRLHARMRGAKASYDKALWLLQRVKKRADYRVMTKSRSASTCSPRRSTRRSTAGCTPTSSAGSASRARRSVSDRCSPARSSAR